MTLDSGTSIFTTQAIVAAEDRQTNGKMLRIDGDTKIDGVIELEYALHSHYDYNIAASLIFNDFAQFVPNVGDRRIVTGALVNRGSGARPWYLYQLSRVERKDTTTLAFDCMMLTATDATDRIQFSPTSLDLTASTSGFWMGSYTIL